MLLHNQGCRLVQSLHFRKVVQDAQRRFCADSNSQKSDPKIPSGRPPISVQKIRTVQGSIHLDVMATHPDTHQSSTRNQIFFTNTYMGRQLHPSGRQGNIVQTRSLIRQHVKKNYSRLDVREIPSKCGPYYGNYMQHKCNCSDARATPSERGPNMESLDMHYGKSVAQLFVWTTSACVQMPPREIRFRLVLQVC